MTEAEQEEMQKEIQKQIKETYARMNEGKKSNFGAKHRKEKREAASQRMQEDMEMQQLEQKVLKVTEFVTVNDLATLMNNTPVTKVIGACMSLGMMVSINQRLDAETLVLVAEEFGYEVEFVTANLTDAIAQGEAEDTDDDLVARPPVITVMGHVDHGKTSLLDHIRNANVIAGEAGGITQHIGAYHVELPDGQRITFLDTPGHEAFTAMRARGAKMTDVAIIIVAADDCIMPQTVEAISHAQAAGVPMIFAINKIDKPGANPEKIREQLSNMNILVEDWGGKYQCQEISAKKGINVDLLLDKVLLEAEMLELKANPNRRATGAVIESSLDKGRGYLATVLVQNGTMRVGDVILSGCYTGRVKAMFNERGQKVDEAGPSTPVSVLGLNGAPTAGETFNVMADEKEAKDIANKREQLIRIQGIKTQKHMTLEEIGRRIAIGNFKELNVIVKGDVDGSVEALSDSIIKLSTEEVRVNVIHKAVGAISESDILLAAASDAIIIGFQVRPSVGARKLAEKEEIEIRLYSVIYDCINELKSGIEGMLEPEQKEVITATAEVQETFKISKVGTIAGCIVREGKLQRTAKVRVIRDGIVVYTGELGSLKRFKDDAKEVLSGMDCGLNIQGYNDIKVGDVVEAYTIEEIKRKL
jgi:translation initiation factor IF-2